MTWKRIKLFLLIILGLILLVPTVLYISSIDWTKAHTKRVNALAIYERGVDQGEYRIGANGLEFFSSGKRNAK